MPAPSPAADFELWVKPRVVSMPGGAVTVWGYATSATGEATVPGPRLVVPPGDTAFPRRPLDCNPGAPLRALAGVCNRRAGAAKGEVLYHRNGAGGNGNVRLDGRQTGYLPLSEWFDAGQASPHGLTAR